MVNIDGGYQLKVNEQAPFLLASQKLWLGHLYIVAINKTTWEDLEQRDKEAIIRAGVKSYEKLGAIMDKSFTEQLKKLQNVGTTYRILSDKELTDFENSIQYRSVQENWVKEQESKGIRNLMHVLKKMRQVLKQ